MQQIVEIETESGTKLQFEVTETEQGIKPASKRGTVIAATESLKESLSKIRPLFDEITETISNSVKAPQSIEIEVGLMVKGDVKGFLVTAGGSAHIKVKATWTKVPSGTQGG